MNESALPRNQADLPATNQVAYPAAAAKRNLRLEARKATLYSPQRRKARKEQERNKTGPALPGLVRNPQLASSTAGRAQSKSRYSRAALRRHSTSRGKSHPATVHQNVPSMAKTGKMPCRVCRYSHGLRYLRMRKHPSDTMQGDRDGG